MSCFSWIGVEIAVPSRRTVVDLRRGECAAARLRIGGGGAIAAAYAQVEATFSPASHHAVFKDRVAALIERGPAHPEVWMRYGMLAKYRPANLAEAIACVERMNRAEVTTGRAALQNWGRCSRPRLAMMRLAELRLILRLLRRFEPGQFPGIVATVLHPDRTAAGAAAGATDTVE